MKKGQMGMLGIVLVAFVGIIVGLALYQSTLGFVGSSTGVEVGSYTNSSITLPASGATLDLTGQELIGTPIVINDTGSAVVPTTNYTIYEGVASDGVKGIIIKSEGGLYEGLNVNITYSYYPDGYIDNAGARSMALLIPIFAALAIALVALIPALKSGIMDLMK